MVEMCDFETSSPANLDKILVLPTPESPTIITLNK